MTEKKPELRIPEPAWLGSRARNAARRPFLVGLVAFLVVGLAVVALVLAPKDRRTPGPAPAGPIVAVDTVPIVQSLAQSHARVTSAESALVVVRQQVLAAAVRPVIDTLDPRLIARHDSLTNVLTELSSLITKVESVPLASSYRALAVSPALFGNARITALLDSLTEVERQRQTFDVTSGGADPMFVALTSRATEIGRAIEIIAAERRDSLRADIQRIATPTRQLAAARDAAPDTMPWVAERDSARSAVAEASADLDAARTQLAENARERERATQITALSASPFAMLIAAGIFGIVIGFAIALQSELRRPTVADGPELERATGARVMATVIPAPVRRSHDRRKADRLAPGYLEPKSDAYQLAYLHVDQSAATPDMVAIVGDDPDVSAIVAVNIAAIAAEDARSVLVVDAAGRSEAIKSLLPFSASGDLTDLIQGLRTWVDSTAHVSVGRDKTVDVVTGMKSASPQAVVDLLQRERARLGRYYDSVFVIGMLDLIPVIAESSVVNGTVLTASAGRTRLSAVIDATRALRDTARQVFGVVLWDAPPPRLAARPKRTTGGNRRPNTPPIQAPQPTTP